MFHITRVLKTKNLRVIDGSGMPEIVNGNTAAPIMMMAEKGAHFIRQYWSSQYLICDLMHSIFYAKSENVCFYSQLI